MKKPPTQPASQKIDSTSATNTVPTIPELIATAAAINGAAPFPITWSERERLLRDALAVWIESRKVLKDLTELGEKYATEVDFRNRIYIGAEIFGARPEYQETITGDALIGRITGCARKADAYSRFREWAKTWTERDPASELERYKGKKLSEVRVAKLSLDYAQWYSGSLSEKRKKSGAAGGKAKRPKK